MSSQKDHLLRSFVRQIESIFKMTVINKDKLSSEEQFEIAINLASENTTSKIVLVVDSIDQMDATSCNNIGWLPKMMPPKTFLLVSTISGEPEFEQLNTSIRHYYSDRIIVTEIQPLSKSEVNLMTRNYLNRFDRTLQSRIISILLVNFFHHKKITDFILFSKNCEKIRVSLIKKSRSQPY